MARRLGMDKEQTYRINVLDRAVSVLKVFNHGEGELSLKQLTDCLLLCLIYRKVRSRDLEHQCGGRKLQRFFISLCAFTCIVAE